MRSEDHYLGVANLNLAMIRIASGNPEAALGPAEEAIDLLSRTSGGVGLVSARIARASALSFVRQIDEARREIDRAAETTAPGQLAELAYEAAAIEAHLGDPARAWPLVEKVDPRTAGAIGLVEQIGMVRGLLCFRTGEIERAIVEIGVLEPGRPASTMAFEAQRRLVGGLLRIPWDHAEGIRSIELGTALAKRQGAFLWAMYGDLLGALLEKTRDPSEMLILVSDRLPAIVSMLADQTMQRLEDLSPAALSVVRAEARLRPWRWRAAARAHLEAASPAVRREAALLLEQIGEGEDVVHLRRASRSHRDATIAPLALSLARRLAPRVFVEDLGRVRIDVGGRRVEGIDVRRKVLALLCLLLTKPRFASTREEVADALWPDQDPASALNSLNQSVYFLRRVFEPDYRDEASPIYVGQDGETIWLDPDLVQCRSRRCGELVRAMPGDPTPQGALELAREYRGRFALDFAYEDWASGFRDILHASYLRVLERAIQIDLDTGHFTRGTFLAERATEVDPDADEIQLALVRLYRLSGAYAAAAEQYGRYSRTMQDLGVEPRPLSEI
jgi:DNA-binding SARP family transcriptional activator